MSVTSSLDADEERSGCVSSTAEVRFLEHILSHVELLNISSAGVSTLEMEILLTRFTYVCAVSSNLDIYFADCLATCLQMNVLSQDILRGYIQCLMPNELFYKKLCTSKNRPSMFMQSLIEISAVGKRQMLKKTTTARWKWIIPSIHCTLYYYFA